MAELFEAGKLKPVVDGPYRLSQVPDAMRHFGEGRHKGKVVISIGGAEAAGREDSDAASHGRWSMTTLTGFDLVLDLEDLVEEQGEALRRPVMREAAKKAWRRLPG